jgi:hypothetical protein
MFGVYSRTYASHDNVTCVVLTRQRSLLPRNASGIPCSYPQRGYCDGVSGSCVCPNGSAVGFFRRPVTRRV